MSQQTLPVWAVQRVTAVLQSERKAGNAMTNPKEVARRTGLSKRLAQQCMTHLKRDA